MMFSKEEQKQYSRHLILDEVGVEGQQKLKEAKVLVIGAGGLGCPILQYIAAAGVGTIGVIDDDTVDQTNLQRQILYTHEDIGLPKAEQAAKRLQAINPYITVTPYVAKLTKENALDLFAQYDIIVDGSDNFATRYLVNDASVLTNKPLVFGSIFKFEGQVSVFNYEGSPTYRCLYPNPPQPGQVPNCSEIGVIGVLPGIIGSLQANEVIKLICGIGTVLKGKLLSYNALSMQQFILNFSKNEDIEIKELIDYEFFCGITLPSQEITYEELLASGNKYNLLDVRSYEEHEAHNIGGINIPLNELLARIDEVSLDKPLVVYCQTGVRSARAIEILEEEFSDGVFVNLVDGVSG
ncbi:MAG: molybdopterin-synthase adenylyltransferase MoeB [Flavobacteriales bacterium]|nr:molybdopterin-synthase adenylyltransferase MoeB [Flavobacteriales bacterium]